MKKKIAFSLNWFLVLALALFSGNVLAFSIKNIGLGEFRFELELKDDGEVDEVNLDLIFLDASGTDDIALFDGLVITSAGQAFIATEADENFAEAAVLLTNAVSDSIRVLLARSPESPVSIQSTEPVLLYDDFTGDSGIDFAGMTVRFITLEITSAEFIPGFDPAEGAFTVITVAGVVSIILDPVTIEMFADVYGSVMSDINYSIFSDTDGDGDVDGADSAQLAEDITLSIENFAAAYGATVFDINYRIVTDIDGDGDVDGRDLALLVE